MAFWCYILRCADGRYYTGHTDDLERRVGQHQTGGYCRFTSTRRPVALAWCQEFPTRLEALEAERRISPWSRRKKEAMFAGDWDALSYWAKSPGERDGGTAGDGASTSLGTDGRAGSPALSTADEQGVGATTFVPSEVEGRAPAP